MDTAELRDDLHMYVSRAERVNTDLIRNARERQALLIKQQDCQTQIAYLTTLLQWR